MDKKEYNRAAVKKHYYANKEYYYAKNQIRGDKARAFVEEYKRTHPCAHCGESDIICLDFHHTDPTIKDLEVSKVHHQGWGIPRIQKEIDKCVVLCSNCHRKEHNRIFNSG